MWGIWVCLGVLLSGVSSAAEQILTLSSDNDLYTGSGDAYYTNGARASLLDASFKPPAMAEWVAEKFPFIDVTRPMTVQYSVGHNLYTPADITISTPQLNDRPWAAHLYGSIGMANGDKDKVTELELQLGWVGPGAMGEGIQKLVHRNVTGARTPRGWHNQLHDELTANMYLQRRWPSFVEANVKSLRFSFMPHVRGALGNADTHAAMGGTFRLTSTDAVMDNPVHIAPTMGGTGYFQTDNHINAMLFTGAEVRAVGRNIFLDGNTFGSSPHIRKKNLVADVQAGVAFTYKRFLVGYTAVYRSPEFFGQKNGQLFGGVNVAVKF